MKGKKLLKSILFTLCLILVVVAINTCIKIAVNGMRLWKIPKTDDIASVTISYPDITDVQMEITDSEQIETCVQLSTLLNYKLFTFANRIKDRYPITLYYNLKNGEQIKVSANNKAVFYNGKRRILKHENSFVSFVEVLFYQEYLID